MPKNIVICCDGTDNKLTIRNNTNVIHLYSCLKLDEQQIGYYNPGVGTIAPDGISTWLARKWYRFVDLISASSLHTNVKDAYQYLMNEYEEGDKIYLFGFSRGAYTVRMLSGLLEMFGLLHKGNAHHLRHVLDVYAKGDKMFEIASLFRTRFSRKIAIEFIGIWDTVVSVGGLINFYKSFPYSRSLGIAKTVRHAVGIDERRKHYYYYEVSAEHHDCEEVFFAGVHSDVGGSYEEEGLSKITLEWMLGEASHCGLQLDKKKVNKYVFGIGSNYQKPDFKQAIHNSLTFIFKLADFIPRPRYSKTNLFNLKIDFRLWPLRFIAPQSKIHQSVKDKIGLGNYQPQNLTNLNDKVVIQNKPIIF
ncbi:Protein of unknown function DUF2235 (plasmid) [Emticicia oligotrophica DSM 17448]|uniref:T6SS Phospholipase effector Tle1-like catalytic domain-containing protein n=1 Tax=Emticicia oligotrophica (strain DSM 17448 / CIP 109782 / MTCC 6937 / GPTSA100-15) TaxID=929562 RepID=A0ABN4ASC1_EMTOG|nr:DUF2235 domain-containing protein [Emticicia oligotrophica]AFK05469.1 Protein of unknown function DUF2235 [Emticicia oligotrophica DSM 17448]